MKIAYIITVYHKPEQLVRLVKNLNADQAYFYVHLDKTKDISFFKSSFEEIAKVAKVKFLKREDSRWGRWGFTKAMLNGMEAAAKEKVPFDYIMTLSGQDQPIKSIQYINEFLTINHGKNFIEHFPMPNPEWNFGGMDRVEHYHFDFLGREYSYPPKKKLKSIRDKILNIMFKPVFKLPRVFPKGLLPYGGSCWFCITGSTMNFILEYLQKNPGYLKFQKYTYLADEIFFQTILLNSGNEKVINSIVNENLIHLEWLGERHLIVFKEPDFDKLAQSKKLFARKFDLEQDKVILDLVEQKLLKQNTHIIQVI